MECSIFFRHFGIAPLRYVRQIRLDRAAYLLHPQNLHMLDIAQIFGFENAFHFSRSFWREFAIPLGLPMRRRTAQG